MILSNLYTTLDSSIFYNPKVLCVYTGSPTVINN